MLAEAKPYQLMIARHLGFNVPPTRITSDIHEVTDFSHRYKLVAKAVSSGYVRTNDGNSAIFTSTVSDDDLLDLDGLAYAPVTFQEHMRKFSDIRVTVVGDRVYAAEILSQGEVSSQVDWRATENPELPHRRHELPAYMVGLCSELVKRFDLVFGAIDLILTERGDYVFLEINPNGEWAWIEDKLGFPIAHDIAEWLNAEVV